MIMASRSVKVVMMWVVMILVLEKAEYSNSSNNNNSSSVGCLKRERVALFQLKSVFNYPSWAYNSWASWVDEDNSNYCEWPMIECHPNTGRVIALYLNSTSSFSYSRMDSWYLNVSMFLPFEELKNLSLSNNNIAGFIENKGFERLSNLEVLDLSRNFFNNSVLAYLSGFSYLKYLDLAENYLEAPTHFNSNFGRLSGLTNLEFLDLSWNYLLNCSIESVLKLEDFINLKELHLQHNNMRFFQGFKKLSNLEVLDLSENFFNNSDLAYLSGLSSLKYLSLRFNSLEAPTHFNSNFERLSGLTNLETLDLSANQLNCSIESLLKLEDFINLKELHLAGNELNSSVFASIRGLSKLKFLDLSYNNIEGSIDTKELHDLSNLEELDLSENCIDNFVNLKGMEGLPSLRVLRMEYNQFNTNSTENLLLTGLRNLSSLEIFSLDGASINNNALRRIGALITLEVLSLVDCDGLTGTLPSQGLCDLRNLQELYLDGNQLEGTLPQCWGNFTLLRMLTLSNNNFSGNISLSPLSILTSLEYLAIDRNHFEIPISFRSFYNHSNLKSLRCDDNILIPELESNNWAPRLQLEYFSFSNGNMDKLMALPSFLSHQYNLRVLYASNNNLSGTFPKCLLHNNTKLEDLYLNGNSLGGPLEWPSRPNPNTQNLDFSENKLEGRIPPNISFIYPHLFLLNLSNNYFHGNIPSSFQDVYALIVLDLSNNHFSGVMPEHFLKNCPSLRMLALSGNNFFGNIPPALFNLTGLEHLWLGRNNFTGVIQDIFPPMSLATLDISDNHFFGELPRWTGNMTFLFAMVMSRNHFQGPIPTEFCKLNDLRILDLSENNLHGSIPSCFNPPLIEHIHLYKNSLEGPMTLAFYNNTRLETLDLGENNISGSIPRWIGSISRLSYLLLKANNLEGVIPTEVCQLSRLKIMDLSQNRLSGSLPLCLGTIPFEANDTSIEPLRYTGYYHYGFNLDVRGHDYLVFEFTSPLSMEVTREKIQFTTKRGSYSYKGTVLSYMSGVDLSCNQLTGELPSKIGNLSNIHALNLSHNNLTGSIPTTFSMLRQIESLDISYNKLNGRIPSQLTQLNFLSAFSVAHNNLSGKTPDQNQQFANFDESSYQGNPLLCGPPLHGNCGEKEFPLPVSNASSLPNGGDDSSYMEAFYMSLVGSYVVVLLGIVVVLYINPYWRQAWFYFVEKCMMTSYYFVVDNFPKLSKRRTG